MNPTRCLYRKTISSMTYLLLYAIATCCWLVGVWLQHRMSALASGAPTLPPLYSLYLRVWMALGLPSTAAMVGIFYLMVFKPV